MTDFAASLRRGLEAAESAERAREEIDTVLAELAAQLTAVLAQPVSVMVASRETAPTHRPSGIGALFSGEERVPRMVAALRVETGGRHQFLCDFERAATGYPVDVRFADMFTSCNDKGSLEQTLANMLEHPVVAGKIRAIVARS